MSFDTVHSIDGSEMFIYKTPMEIGIPMLHILTGRVGTRVKYFEFSADEEETMG